MTTLLRSKRRGTIGLVLGAPGPTTSALETDRKPFGRPWATHGPIFTDLLNFPSDIEKSTVFSKDQQLTNIALSIKPARPGLAIGAKSTTLGMSFCIDYSTFFENGKSVK